MSIHNLIEPPTFNVQGLPSQPRERVTSGQVLVQEHLVLVYARDREL